LLDYGFANYRVAVPVKGGQVLARPAVHGQPGVLAPVVAARTFRHVFAKGERISTKVQITRRIAGPLRRHTVVGRVVVYAGKRVVTRVRLLLAKALPAPKPAAALGRFIRRPSTLVSLFVLLGAAMAVTVRRRARTRHPARQGGEMA
jgi:hypothetical protein